MRETKRVRVWHEEEEEVRRSWDCGMGIFSRERFIMRGEQRSDCCTRFLTLTRKTTEEVRGSPPSACSSSGAGGTSQIPMHHVRTRGRFSCTIFAMAVLL